MVDFSKLKKIEKVPEIIDPIEIFRRMPKPEGINDLYSSQSEVLNSWYKKRDEADNIIKLHTGGGKTMVGLLIAQSTINELKEPVLYLAPTNQLVNQTYDKAVELGISAVKYKRGESLSQEFVNGKAIMIATYSALFNGKSKFGIQGKPSIQNVAAIIFDDAHAALSVIRDNFTLEISRSDHEDLYGELCSHFRKSFIDIGKQGTFDEVVDGKEEMVLEVPYWEFIESIQYVSEKVKNIDIFSWPLIRDQLTMCHCFISKNKFTITPIQPMLNIFPTFMNAKRKIYMSATISDDGDIIRTFNVTESAVDHPLTSKSVAGISERMILIPGLMDFPFDSFKDSLQLLKNVAEREHGAVIISPSDEKASRWEPDVKFLRGSEEVNDIVEKMQNKDEFGPVVFSNRYDGIDLPGDACRLLIMDGIPMGTSSYEIFRATALMGGDTITRMMTQRIEQGLGRGARGSSDYCIDILVGKDLTSWISLESNFSYFTSATKAQIEIGKNVSKEVKSISDLSEVINQSLNRDSGWTGYHSRELVEYIDSDQILDKDLSFAMLERKIVNLCNKGCLDKAIEKINEFLEKSNSIDKNEKGWLQQLAARIAYILKNKSLSKEYQNQAYFNNTNLFRSNNSTVEYIPLKIPSSQSKMIIRKYKEFKEPRGILAKIDEIESFITPKSSANQFEEALKNLGIILGFSAERYDDEGVGPDLLWLISEKKGLIIEAKSRKKENNAFRKEEHGQLLVAEKWFKDNYSDIEALPVSVHSDNKATHSSYAENVLVLTLPNILLIISEVRKFYNQLIESHVGEDVLEAKCQQLLSSSNLSSEKITGTYLTTFETMEDS
ncbi:MULTISPECIES: DEAD/DEAH box helicase [Enterococcus]|uniref:DEAD/DEAH box helicase n=1 Tax=Enterococcus mundtii TaxID=53346 RepID=A0AAI8WF65_ENTMU|nr:MULTISPECIES: DEAD/DEAH box helicase [Enterococcus]BBM16344.1 DEAD/DEAH box helicase [Enterococcus mundtii]